jgi:hypothetical protein
MKFDIPINFTIEAPTEAHAEAMITQLLKKNIKRHNLNNIIHYNFFEFLSTNSCKTNTKSYYSKYKNNNC